METDEMELDTIGDRKTALFVIISDTDDTFNFVVSILYTQLFPLLPLPGTTMDKPFSRHSLSLMFRMP